MYTGSRWHCTKSLQNDPNSAQSPAAPSVPSRVRKPSQSPLGRVRSRDVVYGNLSNRSSTVYGDRRKARTTGGTCDRKAYTTCRRALATDADMRLRPAGCPAAETTAQRAGVRTAQMSAMPTDSEIVGGSRLLRPTLRALTLCRRVPDSSTPLHLRLVRKAPSARP